MLRCFYINFEYLCDDENLDYCYGYFNNAINNGPPPPQFRHHCKLCCNAPNAGSYVFSVLKDCYANEKCDGIYDPAFSSIRCVFESDLSNGFESCNSVNMIKNDLLSILASLYFPTFFMWVWHIRIIQKQGMRLGIWICGCSLFYKREHWASKCKGWCPKDLRVRAPAAP